MSDKASAAAAPGAASRGRGGDWSKSKAPPKRGKSKPLKEESEESEEEGGDVESDEEEEEEEEEEEADVEDDDDDDDDSASDSGREQQRKKPTRKPSPSAKQSKGDDKRKPASKKAPPPPSSNARGRKPSKQRSYESDGSETSSQNATDDEMTGRRAVTPANAGRAGGRGNGERGGGGIDANESGNASPLDGPTRERNSSMTLPSLSRAAMIHLNRGRDGVECESASNSGGVRPDKRDADDVGPPNGYSASSNDANNRGPISGGGGGGGPTAWRRDRSRSRSRERPDLRDGGGRRSEPKGNGRGILDEGSSAYAPEGTRGPRELQREPREPPPPASPGHDNQDVRIMFHGREIYADDLIGLRVAKTFVGHGRFLGQVVKFDEPTSLYTIVYADGDAEEMSIENTIQILIQDEIERADPSVPPVASAFRNDRIPDSPEGGSVTPASSTATVSVPVAPLNTALSVPPPQSQQHQPPAYLSRRASMAFTEREAQFVIGVFENNALPVLLRQGWRVQSNASGSEQRFYAPPGNFRGAGHVFTSAIDVVELIVFDNELMSACFPQNMHSVILSLFQDSAPSVAPAPGPSRKRGSPAVPPEAPDGYDSKRVRGSREGGYPGGGGGAAPMLRGGGGPGVGGATIGLPPGRSDDRLVPPVAYRQDDRGRGERDAYAPQRIAPLASGERFPGPSTGRGGDPGDSYRRGSGSSSSGEYRSSLPQRPLSSEGGAPLPSSSRWPGPPSSGAGQEQGDYHHRRGGYGDAPEWHDRDLMGGRGGPPPSSTNGYLGGRSSVGGGGGVHRGEEPNRGGGVYYGAADRGLPRASGGGPGLRPGGPPVGPSGAGGDEPPSSYGRYRDARGPPPSGGQYSPGPDSFSNRYPPSRGEPPAADYRGPPGGGAPPQGLGDRFARPLSRGGSGNGGPPGPSGPGGASGRGFSMMDVDRNVSGGGAGSSGSYEHHRGMERGRSPHLGESGGPPPQGSGSYGGPPSHMQHYSHHQRSGSNGSVPNPADDSRSM